jgi:ferredoxin
MAKRVIIDQDECIGCGSCEEICQEVFKLNEETEKAEVIKPEGGPEDLIQEAIESCPVECIYWEE